MHWSRRPHVVLCDVAATKLFVCPSCDPPKVIEDPETEGKPAFLGSVNAYGGLMAINLAEAHRP